MLKNFKKTRASFILTVIVINSNSLFLIHTYYTFGFGSKISDDLKKNSPHFPPPFLLGTAH
jgi:hypothetical protein